MRLSHALVRRPAPSFAEGLTGAGLGSPNTTLAKAQHDRYCEELERCGLRVTRLPIDARHPDGTFVEDTAILTGRGSILARPGAQSRLGEVESVGEALMERLPPLGEITPPGTLDGGDVCDAGDRFLIGISERTNEEGARQLAALLGRNGYQTTVLDVRGLRNLLHLKSGLAALGDGRLVAVEALARRAELRAYEIVPVRDDESYAANCVRINDRLLIARGFPILEAALEKLRYEVVTLEMSEFRKMDGGLTCLSLRF